jgi:TRAP-type C4-dicarboxylate transport system permease large subunit
LIKESVPLVLILLVALAIVMIFPEIILFLPRLLGSPV